MDIAFIGCGGFATGTHIPNVSKNRNFEIKAFCDLNQDTLDKLKAKYNPDYVTTDMSRVFSDKDVEMVICSTKPDCRMPIMQMAVDSGKHLFVEKPLCFDSAQLNPMVRLIQDSSIKFMVGFNRPYSPMMRDAKRLYKELRKEGATIIYRIIGEAQLWPKHHYDAVVVRKESTIIHEVTHIFDLLNWLTDSVPFRVFTAGDGNMDNIITLEYPDRVNAVIIAGDNSTSGFPKERIEINCSHSTILGDHFIELNSYQSDGGHFSKTYPYKMAGKPMRNRSAKAGDLLWKWRRSITEEEKKYGYYYDRMPKVDKGHDAELEFFRQAILEDLPVETNVMSGAIAQLTAEKALLSWSQHAPVELDFSKLG